MSEDQFKIEALVGKKIERAEVVDTEDERRVLLAFTDGSLVTLLSWDFEMYSSGIRLLNGWNPQ